MFTRNPIFVALFVSLACWTTSVHADEPIQRLADAKPNQGIFENATRNNPLVLRSNADAAMHFDKKELAQLRQSVDFEKQIVLVFAWKGSGQDRLTFDVAESFPEQVGFRYHPGRTRDLRPHVYVFALRSNVVWRSPDGTAGGETAGKDSEYIKVEVQGKLNSQVMAIGGETTGVTITANGVSWELELGDQRDLRRAAEQLHDKFVVVKGRLTLKQGVEIRQRWIVKVNSLVDANAETDSNENP